MFVQHGSDFAKNQLPKLESQMKEAFPRDGPLPRPTLSLSPASEFSGQRTRQVNEEFRKTNFQQAAQTGCSNLFYDLKRDDIFRRDVIIPRRPISLNAVITANGAHGLFDGKCGKTRCLSGEKCRPRVPHHPSKNQAR